MRAHLCANLKAALHLIERSLEIGIRNSSNYLLAFVADECDLISAVDAIQAAAAIRISEQLMRKHRGNDSLNSGAMADGAIARPGERRQVTIAVDATRKVAIA